MKEGDLTGKAPPAYPGRIGPQSWHGDWNSLSCWRAGF
jgi:hypothetical protein